MLLPKNKGRKPRVWAQVSLSISLAAMCDEAKEKRSGSGAGESAAAFIALISRLLEERAACVGVWAGTWCTRHGGSSSPLNHGLP